MISLILFGGVFFFVRELRRPMFFLMIAALLALGGAQLSTHLAVFVLGFLAIMPVAPSSRITALHTLASFCVVAVIWIVATLPLFLLMIFSWMMLRERWQNVHKMRQMKSDLDAQYQCILKLRAAQSELSRDNVKKAV